MITVAPSATMSDVFPQSFYDKLGTLSTISSIVATLYQLPLTVISTVTSGIVNSGTDYGYSITAPATPGLYRVKITGTDDTGRSVSEWSEVFQVTPTGLQDAIGYDTSVNPLPAATNIATAVWTDTSDSDFEVPTSPGLQVMQGIGSPASGGNPATGLYALLESSGSGSVSYPVGPYKTSAGQALLGVAVTVWLDSGMTEQVPGTGTIYTGTNGTAVFNLNPGSYYAKGLLAGFTITNPTAITVS